MNRPIGAPRRPRIVIVGAGFAGLSAAKALGGRPSFLNRETV
jgi:NADH dehydrogenase FAD-containing subunit